MPWLVGVTKPNQEAVAAENLARQSYAHYYPRIAERKAAKQCIKPLFPRYIFIDLKPAQDWYPIRNTRGMSYLLMREQGPQEIAGTEIQALFKRHDTKGLVCLPNPAKFQPGVPVKTEAGPLVGLSLIYEGMTAHERCRVLTELLGQKVRVELDEKSLVAA